MLIPFLPPPGLNSDDTTFAAEGRWADGNNVRFWNGRPQIVGGWIAVFGSPTIANCSAILAFNRVGTPTIAYGGQTALYVGSGINPPSDRSPAGLGSVTTWWLAPWGSTLLACQGDGKLYEQSGAAAATEVTAAPDHITCMIVTPKRQVMAFGCEEEISGTINGLCIRWCDFENYDDWTSSSTNNAGEYILDGAGSLVAGAMVGDYIAAWTDDGLHMGTFVGDPAQTYRFDPIARGCGLIAPKAYAVLSGIAYWMAPDYQVWRWAPGLMPEPVPCPISRDFAKRVVRSSRKKIVLSSLAKWGEIWAYYPDSRDGTIVNSRYIAFSVKDGMWFRGIFGRSAVADSVNLLGALESVSATFIAAAPAGTVFAHEVNITGALEPDAWHIESADQYIEEGGRRLMIREVRPDFEDQGNTPITLTLNVRPYPQSVATAKGPYSLTRNLAKKSLRASGRLISVKLSATPSGIGTLGLNPVRLGKLVFDAVPLGER